MEANNKEEAVVVLACNIVEQMKKLMFMFTQLVRLVRRRHFRNRRGGVRSYSLKSKIPNQIRHLSNIVSWSDTICRNNLRMNTDTFSRLCYLLENVGGLVATRNVSVVEQTALFLHVLSHHEKNVIIQTNYERSGFTISIVFSRVLNALLKLHNVFLVDPIPVDGDCDHARWKFFENCLGALDGSYVEARVPLVDKPRYRN
ncbi:PREDICTED: uncharacterized protein LOC105970216 [Erythranthe guttata]|uniref:uncharacterized protein LOC105970216 n=1 Tax=Erythranthe guttata TaxID=4155 RepID=UPI00064DB6D9|nr:PREDICTED: uncharacterized protein LOC105970216 [Erythranthe guttata]|eukprot:XP_012850480.1 PREDICTED: uncharacterized protein LOC105970216 [Erythranthe guttata]